MIFTHKLSHWIFTAVFLLSMMVFLVIKLINHIEFAFIENIALALAGASGACLALYLNRMRKIYSQTRSANIELQMYSNHITKAFEGVPYGIMLVDDENRITLINQAALDLFKIKSKISVINEQWFNLLAERDARSVKTHLESPQYGHVWSYRFHPAFSNDEKVIYRGTIVTFEGGYRTVTVQNISEFETEQKISNQRLAAIEVAPDGIGIVDHAGNLVYANEALWNLHGINPLEKDSYLDNPRTRLYSRKGQLHIMEDVLPVLKEKGRWCGESPMLLRDGTVLQVEMTLTRIPDVGMVGTVRDVSDRLNAQKEKEILQKQFFQAQKMEAVGRLAGGIAHDFNNILAAIMGYAEFLQDDLPVGSPQQKFASNILQSGGQARTIIDQILSFSRRKDSVRSPVDIAQTIYETTTILQGGMPKTIALDIKIDLEDVAVMGHHPQMAQMLMNLFVNARDAMKTRGLLSISAESCFEIPPLPVVQADLPAMDVSPLIRIESIDTDHTRLYFSSVSSEYEYIKITVADTGSGMTREVMEHIFEPFFSTKLSENGTGLGMATVHGALVGHQAAMIVDSIINQGTKFEIYLPAYQMIKKAQSLAFNAGHKDGTGVVVVVDDQPQVLSMITEMLSRQGYKAIPFADALNAVDYIRENPDTVDLLLSDHMMPGMTGLEMAFELLLDFQDLPVVIISGYNEIQDDIMIADNIKAVIKKPVAGEVLFAEIEKHRLHRAKPSVRAAS